MSDIVICLAILLAVVVLFVWNRLPVGMVAIAAALALWATGILTINQALAGFGDPTVIFIATLFVVSDGLSASGVTAWAGRQLSALSGDSRTRFIVVSMLLVAFLTALINPNGSVAALVPVVALTAIKLGRAPAQALMPLAFGAHAGSMLTLTGTPINVLVADAAEEAGAGRFGFFEFALVGIPLLVGTIAIALLLGKRLLPDRMPERVPPDFSAHLRTLSNQYGPRPEAVITSQMGMAEVIIPPRSGLVGTTVFPGMVTDSGDLVILAVQRGGEDLDTTTTVLAVGDAVLLQGTWTALDENLSDPDVLVVDLPENVRRQAAPLGTSAKWTLGLLAGMVVLLATGLVPAVVAGLLAACGLILLRVMTVTQAYRAISWTTVVLVAGMTSLSVAMQTTGAANLIADTLVQIVRDLGPYALLIGLFIITATLGQLISNMATALIVLPIALSAASEMGVNIEPVLMSVGVAAAAALLTPVATPANLMVMGPAGYRFGDYTRFGLPVLVWFFIVSVFVVPIFWPL